MTEPGFRSIAEFSPIPYYFAVTKGNRQILEPLNRALLQLNVDRPYLERELYDKYFHIAFSTELTASDRMIAAATAEKPLTVGVIPSSAPACYYDEARGEYVGIVMEILKAVSEKTGLQFNFVPLDLSMGAPVAQLKAGSPDLVAGIVKTPRFENDDSLALSGALMNDSLVMVGRKGEDFTKDPETKTIAVMTGFQVAAEYVAEQFPAHATVSYPTIDECLAAVMEGTADAAVYTRTCVNHFLQDPHYENLEALPAYSRDMDTCMAGLSPERAAVIGVVNKGLSMISENERNSILMNTTIMNPYRLTLQDMAYKYRVPFFIIGLLLLTVIGTLLGLNGTKRRSEKQLQAAYAKEQAARRQEQAALALAEQPSAAKGSFMSRMSHEIRTPLNAVIGYNTIARNEMTAAKTEAERRQAEMKVMDCLTKSDIAGRHLLTIINDVLDMSTIESGKITIAAEPFDFKKLIFSLTTVFYSQARAKGVDFEVFFDALTEEWFKGDQMRVNQILTNLLSNAIKFTGDGGSVKLTVRQPEPGPDAVRIHFEIADTGIGMTPEYLDRIWAPFEQADSSISRRFGGTGLGLSITKNLVDMMGGTIRVESAPGQGSTFFVDLSFGRTEQPGRDAGYDFSGVNALVADDDPGTCDYIKLLFSRCGARCDTVTSGTAALDAFKKAAERKDPYTVCLVDWRMPGMDGLETVSRIRRIAGSELPIIVITAYDFSEVADRAMPAGVSRFLSKPLFQSSLFDLLADVCGRQELPKPVKPARFDFSGSRVLLTEDNSMNMEIARRILESTNLAVDCAWNGQEAVTMFSAAPAGTYRAILMDVQMPVMNGHEAARAIRASDHPEARTVPIIALTADAFAENVAETRASGMNDHLSKPINVTGLFETLSKYIPGKR